MRLFKEAKIGDTLIETIGDPRTHEVWTTIEYTIVGIEYRNIEFNNIGEVYDCDIEYKNGNRKGMKGESLFLHLDRSEEGFLMPNEVIYRLSD